MGRPAIPFEERFWPRVKQLPNGCWQWQGALAKKTGYGRCSYNGRESELVHRAAYMHLVGPILDELTVDHLCRNRGCVNPDHLELVTRGENSNRGDGPTGRNARKTHCKRGHPFTGDNVIVKNGKRACRECRRIYDRSTWAANPERAAALRDTRLCAVCGTTFECYKHHKTSACSRKCAAVVQWQKRRAD